MNLNIEQTTKILKKCAFTPQNNWISLLNSANLIKKNAVTPVNFHLYHYAGNNPIRYTDPDGRNSGAPPEAIKRYEQIQQQKIDAILTEKDPIDHYPYSVQKEISDREFEEWQMSFWPPKRSEKTMTPFSKQNTVIHDKERHQYKHPKVLEYNSVIDQGVMEADFIALRFGGEFDTPVFFGLYFNVLDNYIHYANNDKEKGIDFNFSLLSVNLVFGVRTEEYTRRVTISPELGFGLKAKHGEDTIGFSGFYHLDWLTKKIPILNYVDYEKVKNNE